jgi:glycosyltransferase involved in cell wall biosynthesis
MQKDMIKSGEKVLIVSDSWKSLMDFRGKLIEELAKKHKVYVFTPKILQHTFRERLVSLNVEIFENNLNGSSVSVISDIHYIIQLYKLIKQIKPSIFFPYTFKPVIYGTILAKICRVKVVVPMLTGLGYNFAPDKSKNWIKIITHFLLKASLYNSKRQHIIFQNKDDHQTLIDHKIISSNHKSYIVNGSGVDLKHYSYKPPNTDSASFLMIARLINAKGIYEYYEAARIIHFLYPNIQFKLIGALDNNIDAISSNLFNAIKSGKTIQYLGEVDDVRPYINNASVVVLPSYYGEGIPRCLLEAMAMGRAIITCNSVGCKETVNFLTEINGFLVPVKNVAALVSAIEYYLLHPDIIVSHGLNGLLMARKKFDVNLVNTEILKIMQLN